MPNCNYDKFNNKFKLLCSQESHDEIHWSSTDSSEYENVSNNGIHRSFHQQNRKRKRKRKVPKNISNLDITVIDVATNDKDLSRNKKREQTSPILSSQYHPPYKFTFANKSPIICPKTLNSEKKEISKSPILVLKTASPMYSPKVKKKLFANIENVDKINIKSSTLNSERNSENDYISLKRHSTKIETHNRERFEMNNEDEINKNSFSSATKENKETINLDDSLSSLKSTKDWKLVKKVKSYFDSNFSSESASQVSIQESLTPKNSSENSSKTSDDIEIMNSTTQKNLNKDSTESIKEESDSLDIPQSKKIRYKKNGLAYRLNIMLKKHNASVSLWQHERFLAANSDFVIPKGVCLVFIIQNVEIKYGCFLLQAKNIDNEKFLILINKDYVNNCNISKDMILKVFEPYLILECKDFKLVNNVCKFESVKLHDSVK